MYRLPGQLSLWMKCSCFGIVASNAGSVRVADSFLPSLTLFADWMRTCSAMYFE